MMDGAKWHEGDTPSGPNSTCASSAARPRAEGRLIDGAYGLSIDSGEPIPDERLEAVPTAERTAEEQARFERHAD